MLTHRLATEADIPALAELSRLAIDRLQSEFLPPEQVAASHAVMGVDTQLIADRTYFMVFCDGVLAGCGGWSRRATLYGGNHTLDQRNPALLDPKKDAARVRAMYTHPEFTRRGIGRFILTLCEDTARAEGFARLELMATLSGQPLYRAFGFEPLEALSAETPNGVAVPLVRMGRAVGLLVGD